MTCTRTRPLDHDARRIAVAETVGSNVRRLRKEQSKTIAGLAAEAHLSVSALNQVESGVLPPSLLTCLALAEALDVSLDCLVEGLP